MSENILLKCGKTITFPSMFINIKYPSEGRLARDIEFRYSNSKDDGLSHIDGITISIKDWKKISNPILQGYLCNEPKVKLCDKIRLLLPSLDIFFAGTELDKQDLLASISASSKLKQTIHEISMLNIQKGKLDKKIEILYPLLDTALIRMLLQYQIKNGADVIISPSVPITSLKRINEQMAKAREMNRVSRILFDTVFSGYKDDRDLMHMLTINPSVLKNDHFKALKETLLANNPDQIGIKIMNLTESNTSQIWSLLRFIKDLSKSIPTHIFNVREFGYVTLCYGASTITTPIASYPYFRRNVSGDPPARKGSYYHPIHMTDDTHEMLLEKTRSNNYKFPCHCEICEKFQNMPNVLDENWNKFRRVHFLLVKNMEMKELRDSATHLKIALNDKFGRSHQTVWLPYLG